MLRSHRQCFPIRWGFRCVWFGLTIRQLPMQQVVRRECKDAGNERIILHAAGRHAFATELAARGYPAHVIAEQGGRETASLVQDTCIHANDEVGDAHDALSGDLSGAVLEAEEKPGKLRLVE